MNPIHQWGLIIDDVVFMTVGYWAGEISFLINLMYYAIKSYFCGVVLCCISKCDAYRDSFINTRLGFTATTRLYKLQYMTQLTFELSHKLACQQHDKAHTVMYLRQLNSHHAAEHKIRKDAVTLMTGLFPLKHTQLSLKQSDRDSQPPP